MSNLPNPSEFKNFKLELLKDVKFNDSDVLDNVDKYKKLLSTYKAMKNNTIPKGQISKLFDIEVLQQFDNVQEVLKKYVLFDKRNNDVAITIKVDEEIKTIAVHRTLNGGKWIKKKGSNASYIANSIRDNAKVVFLLVGMKEFLLMELMQFDYIVTQADGIVKNLSTNKQWLEEIKPKIKNKLIVYINENDDSSREITAPLKKELQKYSPVLEIDINELYLFHIIGNGGSAKELPKNYDFVNLVNQFQDLESIQNTLKEFIEMELNNE